MDGKPVDNKLPKNTKGVGTDVTQLLEQAGAGSSEAREYLLEKVYNELRVIAASQMRHERNDHTLGATALVNESYLKLIRSLGGASDEKSGQTEESFRFLHRHAFYKAAATAMRRILIDHARAKATGKRFDGIKGRRVSIDLVEASTLDNPHDLLSLDDALSRLESEDERAAAVVRLRFFAGRQIDEIAEMLEVSSRTVKRDWEFARARLQQLIEEQDGMDG
jgi:RNA polymerase sigma-70 factor (ECF subfamily)